MSRVALIGSWDPRWIADHRRWLVEHGAHQDGWKNQIGSDRLKNLQDQLRNHGHVNFYAYVSKSKSTGHPDSGKVRWRFKVTGLAYHPEHTMFVHLHGDHDDEPPSRVPRPVRAVFTFSGIEESPERELSSFVTLHGKRLTPSGLLSLPCVEDRW